MKTNLRKCEKASKGTCLKPKKLQNHGKKEEERRKGKSEEKGKRRRRKKATVELLVFILPTLEVAHFDRFAEFFENI